MAGRRWSRHIARLFAWTVVLFLAASVAVVLVLRWVDPATSAVMIADRITASMSEDKRFRFRHEWTDLERISPQVRVAVIASEDQKFPYHWGFDFDEIQNAIDESEDGGRSRGASTISQQVAKNLFLWQGRSYVRKALEAWFTLLIEWLWPKERILEVYLNIAEFGRGLYGVGAASQVFFHVTPARINRYQAALLAAVLPSPRRLHVEAPSNFVLRQRDRIVDQMESLGGSDYLAELNNPHPERLTDIRKRRK